MTQAVDGPAADPAAYQPTQAETAVRRTQTVPTTEYEEVDDGPRRRFGGWILLGLVLGALGVLWYLLASGRLDNEGTSVSIDMPSVIDLPSAEAIALLQGEDLEVSTTFEEREDVPPDIVFAQDPDPGVEVEKGDTVTIVVSQGSNAVALPNVVGLQQADAVAQLNGLNMEAVVVEIDTQDQPEGTVLAQDPAPGEEVPEGTRVTLQVVGPAATIAIPDVAGQDQLSAAATLGRNFQVETDQEGSDSVPVGRVTRTDPPAGTMVPRDSVVKMFISAGSPITTVPDLVGLTESAASDRLTNAGLIMDVQYVNLSSDDSRVGIVISQDPEAGVKADVGLTVTIVVGQAIGGATTTFPDGGSTTILFPPIT